MDRIQFTPARQQQLREKLSRIYQRYRPFREPRLGAYQIPNGIVRTQDECKNLGMILDQLASLFLHCLYPEERIAGERYYFGQRLLDDYPELRQIDQMYDWINRRNNSIRQIGNDAHRVDETEYKENAKMVDFYPENRNNIKIPVSNIKMVLHKMDPEYNGQRFTELFVDTCKLIEEMLAYITLVINRN